MGYIQILITACLVFPVLAFLITLPYMIFNYNKYGSILFIRTILIYGFILYLLSAYFLIILPLPEISSVFNMKTELQLIPFSFISDIIRTVNFNIKDINTYASVFKNAFVYQAIYNLLLTVPFGIFLRYYFKVNLKKTILFTFLLSLFFELTQLSGLYFIYPHAYRLFDVDDLIVNTLGGILGYLVTPIFTFLLPNRNELDLKSYQKGMKVTSTKRFFAFLIDISIIIMFIFIEVIFFKLFEISIDNIYLILIALFIFGIFIPLISSGYSVGGKIIHLKIVNLDDSKVKWYRLFLRNIFFYYFYCLFPIYLYYLFKYINKLANNNYKSLIVTSYTIIIFLFLLIVLIRNMILHKIRIYESLSKTKIISTVINPDNNDKK